MPGSRSSTRACTRRPSRWPRPRSRRTPTPSASPCCRLRTTRSSRASSRCCATRAWGTCWCSAAGSSQPTRSPPCAMRAWPRCSHPAHRSPRSSPHSSKRSTRASHRRPRDGTSGASKVVDLLEYQGKQLFAQYDIPVSPGHAVFTVQEAVEAADRIGYPVVVRAQVHVGGGVDIEQVAAEAPDAIARLHVDPIDGLSEDAVREWVGRAKLNPAATDGTVDVLVKLYRAYVDGDADLVEINPLILTSDGHVHALDAKGTLDDNAAFRHEWSEYEATQERDEREAAAHAKGLQYVGLDGYVGIIANGAGLAMSTVDIVSQVGGDPANFIDIGSGANTDVMANALEVINNDADVKSIFINVFGGITKGEEVANGIVQALERVEIRSPIVIRLDGTNADEGRAILAEHASERLVSQPTMIDAARKAVEIAGAAS